MPTVEEIKTLLVACSADQRREIYQYLRAEFPVHPIETELNVQAEVILEAIARSSDLIRRGIRGVIAEAAFESFVVKPSSRWKAVLLSGDHSYDYHLTDDVDSVRVQVKMQRLKDHVPMMARQAYRRFPDDMYVVETQRTRGGKKHESGEDTRPYRFGEFDILAVSLHPSTGSWDSFLFTVANWLLPQPDDWRMILKFQPVPRKRSDTWTDNLDECVEWLKSGDKRRIL